MECGDTLSKHACCINPCHFSSHCTTTEAFAAAHAATEAMVDSIAGRQGAPQQSLGNTAALDTGTGTGAIGTGTEATSISTTGSTAGVNGLAIGSGGVQVGHLGSRTKRPADLSKLTPQQLELERQQAREQQWEDQWFDDYRKVCGRQQ